MYNYNYIDICINFIETIRNSVNIYFTSVLRILFFLYNDMMKP